MPKKVTCESKTCIHCGSLFNRTRHPGGRLEALEGFFIRKFCSHQCYSLNHTGAGHHAFKPEGSVRKDGYIRISVNGDRKYLHRLVVEKTLGRRISKKEHVHHIDENKSNNAPTNLKVCSNSVHRKWHSVTAERDQHGQFA